jgi:hypothetical protein
MQPATHHVAVHLRRAGSRDPLAHGWETHPAGRIGGVQLDLVYRPDRHDVCRAIGGCDDSLRSHLADAGFQQSAVLDDGIEIWVRERSTSVRARLAGFRVLEGGRDRHR